MSHLCCAGCAWTTFSFTSTSCLISHWRFLARSYEFERLTDFSDETTRQMDRLPKTLAARKAQWATDGRGREVNHEEPPSHCPCRGCARHRWHDVVMNKACKSSQHAWCAPMSTVRHHIKTGQG